MSPYGLLQTLQTSFLNADVGGNILEPAIRISGTLKTIDIMVGDKEFGSDTPYLIDCWVFGYYIHSFLNRRLTGNGKPPSFDFNYA
jgi:hypothetical protein